MAGELRLGIAGLGMAFRMKLAQGIFGRSPQVRITAGADDGREKVPIPYDPAPAGELAELASAVLGGKKPMLDARWARASLEVCTGILQSSIERREIMLQCQVPSPVRPAQRPAAS